MTGQSVLRRHLPQNLVLGVTLLLAGGMAGEGSVYAAPNSTTVELQPLPADVRRLAELSSIDFTEDVSLEEASVGDIVKTFLDEKELAAELDGIAERNPGNLADAARSLKLASQHLFKIYAYLKAEDLEALPIALLSQVFAQAQFQNDIRAYQRKSQEQAAVIATWLRSQSREITVPVTCEIRRDRIVVTNQSPLDLTDCVLVVGYTGLWDEQIPKVYSYSSRWKSQASTEIWCGEIHNFQTATQIQVEVLTYRGRSAVKTFELPQRVEAACLAVCDAARKLVLADDFSEAESLVTKVSSLEQSRSYPVVQERITQLRGMLELGQELLGVKGVWIRELSRVQQFYAKHEGAYNKRTTVLCSVDGLDSGTGDIKMSFLVEGERKPIPSYGRIRINYEDQRVQLDLVKAKGRTRSSAVETLRMELAGNKLLATDSTGLELAFTPYNSKDKLNAGPAAKSVRDNNPRDKAAPADPPADRKQAVATAMRKITLAEKELNANGNLDGAKKLATEARQLIKDYDEPALSLRISKILSR